jgi:ribosomal protein S6
MTDNTKSIYEGLFLFPQSVSSDMQSAVDHINSFMERAEAEVIALAKWDERRLAYDIRSNKRGVYFIVYFRTDRDKLTRLERDCNLSELLLRTMITRADHVPAEVIEASEGRAQLADEIKLRDAPESNETVKAVIERVSEAPAEASAEAATEAPAEVTAEAATEAPAEVTAEAATEAPAAVVTEEAAPVEAPVEEAEKAE